MARKKRATKPERVELVNKHGAIARPLTTDVQPWLDQGWKRVTTIDINHGDEDDG